MSSTCTTPLCNIAVGEQGLHFSRIFVPAEGGNSSTGKAQEQSEREARRGQHAHEARRALNLSQSALRYSRVQRSERTSR
jgi:hypothetical protein